MTAAVLPWRIPGFAAVVRQPLPRQPERPSPGVQAIRSRDPDAWNELFSAEMSAIYRYALSRLGQPGPAEDATAEVFEQAWRSAATFQDRGLPVRAWLFGIARHVIGEHRRGFFRRPPQVALEAFDSPVADPCLRPEQIDLARAISSLPAVHGEVINLRFIQGLSLHETADVLGVTVDAVKGRQSRALTQLRDALRD